MPPLSFDVLKVDIQAKINEVLQKPGAPQDPAGFSLIDGFFYSPYQTTFGGDYNIGGPAIVNVAIVGNGTKVIHYYPIKALLPERLKDY